MQSRLFYKPASGQILGHLICSLETLLFMFVLVTRKSFLLGCFSKQSLFFGALPLSCSLSIKAPKQRFKVRYPLVLGKTKIERSNVLGRVNRLRLASSPGCHLSPTLPPTTQPPFSYHLFSRLAWDLGEGNLPMVLLLLDSSTTPEHQWVCRARMCYRYLKPRSRLQDEISILVRPAIP